MTTENETESKNIIRLINEVRKKAGALAPEKSSGVPFPFRGIDGVVNHLNKYVQDAGIVIVPKVIDHVTTERGVDKRVVKTSDITTTFTLYAPDGSSLEATTIGLADDFADRSAAQAQSVAFRVMLLQVFFLPTQSPEPEQTGQLVEDGRKTQTSRTLDNARKVTEKPAETKPEPTTARDAIRVEFIESKKMQAVEVNAQVAKLKAEGVPAATVYEVLLERLRKGEVS